MSSVHVVGRILPGIMILSNVPTVTRDSNENNDIYMTAGCTFLKNTRDSAHFFRWTLPRAVSWIWAFRRLVKHHQGYQLKVRQNMDFRFLAVVCHDWLTIRQRPIPIRSLCNPARVLLPSLIQHYPPNGAKCSANSENQALYGWSSVAIVVFFFPLIKIEMTIWLKLIKQMMKR